MQKIYLLLRSNKQTGPYTFEELLQLNLKPFDLVWVEGRSAAWQYPFEIPALKPYVPETPQAAIPFQPVATAVMDSKPVNSPYAPPATAPVREKQASGRVFVSVPKTYQRPYHAAEEQPAPTARQNFEQPVTKTPVAEPEPLRTNYSKPLEEVEEDYTKWMYQQKTRKKVRLTTRDFVIAGLILLVIGGGYYVVSRPAVTNQILAGKQPGTRMLEQTPAAAIEPQGNTAEMAPQQVQESIQTTVKQPAAKAKRIQAKNPATAANTQTVPSAPAQNSIPGEKTISNIPTTNDTVAATNSEENSTGETAKSKKKKLGERIRDIFTKKDAPAEERTEDVATQEPRPANNRQATRRENSDGAAQTQTAVTEISPEEIDLYSNHNDNWMMGVRDLNITLRNRSSLVIETALVSVKYYDENNRLLDKKTIRFENVPANGKRTVAAPENKWADHAGFELTSATAKDDRYASHQ